MGTDEKIIVAIVLVLVFSFGITIGSDIGEKAGINKVQTIAAQTTCAQYNPISGNFEWIEKIPEIKKTE